MNNGTVFCNQIVRIGNAAVEAFLRHRNHFCKGSRIVAVFRVALRRLQDIINFRIGHVILHNTRCRNHNLALSHIDEEADTVWLFRILFVIKIICNRLTVLGTAAALGQDDHMNFRIVLELRAGSLEVLLLRIRKKRCIVVDMLGFGFYGIHRKNPAQQKGRKNPEQILSCFFHSSHAKYPPISITIRTRRALTADVRRALFRS